MSLGLAAGPAATVVSLGEAEGAVAEGELLGVEDGELLGDGEGELLGEGVVDGVGDGVGDGPDEGVSGIREGEAVTEDGSTWQLVSVAVAACVIAPAVNEAAWALPSTPRVRKLPLSKLTATTRTCPKRIRMACLRCSSGLPGAVHRFGGDRRLDGMGTHIRYQAMYAWYALRIRPCRPGRPCRPWAGRRLRRLGVIDVTIFGTISP